MQLPGFWDLPVSRSRVRVKGFLVSFSFVVKVDAESSPTLTRLLFRSLALRSFQFYDQGIRLLSFFLFWFLNFFLGCRFFLKWGE
ncbi:unnamed protein product [Rhizophagus irregularis]|nr:unnamed protein product [Rhizophagus irregularis]